MLPTADLIADLPVRHALPDLADALATAGAAVLVAPPGTGKTTLVPLALADAGTGRVVVAEPRRVAARAAARRMAALLGEPVGGLVGYTVRGDRRVGPATRVEVVTTGVLVRRLHRDPDLAGVDAVVLDECHERHLDSDLALAFTTEVRATLRPDLRLLATSATVEATRLAQVLDAPVVEARAVTYPVAVHWCPPAGPVDPPHGTRVDPRLLEHVAATVRRALGDGPGDVLVFLPGARELDAVAARLTGLDVAVVTLHGRQESATQDAALRPGPRRRVVLATAVAESSLTVPGVRAVVDAGLSRVPRTDHARGLGTLVTVAVSRASATQRAGRAGREEPGRVYRCWSAAQHERLPAQPEPEIAVADLTGFALDLALWGHPDGTGLALPDPPPAGALRAARSSLHALGALDDAGRVTGRGRAIAEAGTHPRLARALLDGVPAVGTQRAAEVVALLAEEGSGTDGDDLVAALRRRRAERSGPWRQEVRRLTRLLSSVPGTPLPDDLAAALVVGLAYPERLARRRQPGGTAYLMAAGTAAELAPGTRLAGSDWLAVAAADRAPGAPTARIRLAAPLDEATARQAGAGLRAETTEVAWVDGDVVARRVDRLGAVTLVERPLAEPDPKLLRAALLAGLRTEGTGLLSWSREAVALRQRLAFCRAALGEPWPDVSDAALLAAADRWLAPELSRARRRADLARVELVGALRRLLPWPQAAHLDEVAPERVEVPSGSRIRVDYTDPQAPVLAVKVQEVFGWTEAPRLGDGRVPLLLHLLSPAGRPAAVTGDLPSFWRTGYPQVRAELRGRYPRHPWPADPATAVPTRRTVPRRRPGG
ncbi:ATP-dependent helicase [Micromonospora rosaria]|uniref:ATP-dependent helicase n=1 Tax=Micromonospora rosaria TaxID=47874 RepID=A0A136PT00_9ACTN|nr:ATP-dependent helicase HrpB [Micromonospora rosaria]KXK61568.1 ATP-dependent helicase [Micromonospora rosaria]